MDKLPDGLLMMMSGADPEQQLSVHEPLERNAEVTGVEEAQQLSMHCIVDMPGKVAWMVGI